MPKYILVTSPHASLCELLRSSLEETGKYSVRAAKTGAEAENYAQESHFDLAILDSDVEDRSLPALWRALQSQQPALLLMVIPPEEDALPAWAEDLAPHGFLGRPFYLPELLETLEALLERPAGPQMAAASRLRCPKSAAALLDRLLGETFLQSALVFAQQGAAPAFSQSLAEEDAFLLADNLQAHFEATAEAEAAQYVRLGSGDFLVYVVALPGGCALAGLSDASVLLSQARAQTLSLKEALLQAAEEVEESAPEETESAPEDEPQDRPEEPGAPEETEDEEALLISLTELLAEMPPPDPLDMPISAQEWQRLAEDEVEAGADESATDGAAETAALKAETVDDAEEAGQPATESTAETSALVLPWEERPPEADATPPVRREAGGARQMKTQAAYTCILIPRLVRHTLTLEMGEHLKQWLPQHCLAFGWSLEDVSVTAEYLQWTVRVPPSVSQNSLARVIRQRTSENLFNQYPHLKEENTSGNFWAPGDLVIRGSRPPSPEALRNFIYQTRRRQGVYRI